MFIKYVGTKPEKRVILGGRDYIFNPLCEFNEVFDIEIVKWLLHRDRSGLFVVDQVADSTPSLEHPELTGPSTTTSEEVVKEPILGEHLKEGEADKLKEASLKDGEKKNKEKNTKKEETKKEKLKVESKVYFKDDGGTKRSGVIMDIDKSSKDGPEATVETGSGERWVVSLDSLFLSKE